MVDAPRRGSVPDPERDELAADLRRKYEAGQSVRALAAACGRSTAFVRRVLRDSGVVLRRAPSGAAAALDDLERHGVVERAGRDKRDIRLPERIDAGPGVSDLVIEQRR